LDYIYFDLDEFAEVDDYDDFAVSRAMYQRIIKALQELYFDETVPELVRRRILEASIRSPQAYHSGVVRAAYLKGFQQEILEAVQSKVPEIQYQAIRAAGNWSITDA